MENWHSEIVITTDPLQTPAKNWDGEAGATVDFWGVVRGSEDGREIRGIEYEAHQTMAQHQMERLVEKACHDFSLREVILRHRVGFVPVGEASLFLRTSSPHRAAAFSASDWMVTELKRKVPIWKKPLFVRPEAPVAVEG
jgi:molybdopterin synthase catalytic subunit